MSKFSLDINGQQRDVDVASDTPLLWVLRDSLELYGAKFGCGVGQCGACTVHLNGVPSRSCLIPVASVGRQRVTTVEGLAGTELHPLQQAWIELDVPQCGYCQSGQIMATVSFLKQYPNPTDAEIDSNITNICRCGTYERLRRAIHRAADMLKA